MNGLTPRQQQVLDYLRSCGDQTPTYRQIAHAIGGSAANIFRFVRKLEASGFIYRVPGKSQTMRFVNPDLSRFSTEELQSELARRAGC